MLGYDPGWEAGGSKFWATTNLVVESNYVHDNKGPGLWTDNSNVGTLYDSNTVINNLNEGIKHEISYNAIIRNNTVKGNGNTPTVWLWNSQIEVQNSSNVEVYGNTVEVPADGGNGIGIINQNRGSGTLGPWVAANNYIHGNTVKYLGSQGGSGWVDDTGGSTAIGNLFDSDRFILQNGGSLHWDLASVDDVGRVPGCRAGSEWKLLQLIHVFQT
jgi:parallel beta-helix repeat protein